MLFSNTFTGGFRRRKKRDREHKNIIFPKPKYPVVSMFILFEKRFSKKGSRLEFAFGENFDEVESRGRY